MNKWFELNYTIEVIMLITGGVLIAGMILLSAISIISDRMRVKRARRKRKKEANDERHS